jgi:biopolymer transport protein ExbD
MAGVDVGGGGRRRAVAADINMIPFIDLLFVTIAFLLITAVWAQSKQLSSNAEVPGEEGPAPPRVQRTLEVSVRDATFELMWREGGTVMSTTSLPRKPLTLEGHVSYPDLTRQLASEWEKHAQAETDCQRGCQTTAIMRTDDRLPFSEVIAVLDALSARKHEAKLADGRKVVVPVFNTTFSAR